MIQFKINFIGVENRVKHYELISYERHRFVHDWKNFERMHSHAKIIFISDGQGYFRSEGRDIKISKGMVIIVNPSIMHAEISSKQHPLEYALFSVKNFAVAGQGNAHSGLLVSSEDNAAPQRGSLIFDYSSCFAELFSVLENIEAEAVKHRPFWELAVLNEFNRFMLFLLRKGTLISIPHDSSKRPTAMNRVELYIRSQHADDITLDKIANLFYMNKYYLAHAFKKQYGISPIKYLNMVRCEDARDLLKTTSLSISQIATSVGFYTISHFCSLYRRFFNETPQETRKNAYMEASANEAAKK